MVGGGQAVKRSLRCQDGIEWKRGHGCFGCHWTVKRVFGDQKSAERSLIRRNLTSEQGRTQDFLKGGRAKKFHV